MGGLSVESLRFLPYTYGIYCYGTIFKTSLKICLYLFFNVFCINIVLFYVAYIFVFQHYTFEKHA